MNTPILLENLGGGKGKFQCECSNTFITKLYKVKVGHTRSCGCIRKNRWKTHGMFDSTENTIWKCMKNRCYNPNYGQYKDYGGRGIKVCNRWLESFENFYKDMGSRPGKEYTLDRKNNDLEYSPDNCKWSTKKEQQNNMQNNNIIEFNGKSQTISLWAEELKICKSTLYHRLYRSKWSIEKVFTTPVRKRSATYDE